MLVISRLGFEGWVWVLVASILDICILFTFRISALMRTLKSLMDCADTVLAGIALQSRIADEKNEPW